MARPAGTDKQDDDEQATDVAQQVVLGQIGEHIEPKDCRECGRPARACGRSPSFCCAACAGKPGETGTSFLTHYLPGLTTERPGGGA